MVSLWPLASITLLCVICSATAATGRAAIDSRADIGIYQGRKLLDWPWGNVQQNGQANQAAVDQNAQATGNSAIAANVAQVDQTNEGGSGQVNQAAVNQNAQATGNGAIAANVAQVDQTNQGGSGQTNQAAINQNAQAYGQDATASNFADVHQTNEGGSGQTNQAAVNQNAQAAGTGNVSAASVANVSNSG